MATSSTTSAPLIEQVARRVQSLNSRYGQAQRTRAQHVVDWRKRIKHTAYVMFFLVIMVALGLDLINWLKDAIEAIPYIGWVIGILVSLVRGLIFLPLVYLIRRRTKKIVDTGHDISQQLPVVRRQLTVMRQRLRPAMQASKNMALWHATTPDRRTLREFVKFGIRHKIDNLLIQLADSIPLVDLLPVETANVVRLFWEQQSAYRRAHSILLDYQQDSERLARLERFEIEYLAHQLHQLQLRELQREGVAAEKAKELSAVAVLSLFSARTNQALALSYAA